MKTIEMDYQKAYEWMWANLNPYNEDESIANMESIEQLIEETTGKEVVWINTENKI